MQRELFERLSLLIGPAALDALSKTRVILFGAGGVGSWCAEGLIRNGIGQLTLVDADQICTSNINRQLQSLAGNVGKVKVTELADRLRAINPEADIVDLALTYGESSRSAIDFLAYDYVIDAIDSLCSKVDLILSAIASSRTLFSSLGAANKLDPTQIKVGSFWHVRGCPLGRMLRKRLRRRFRNLGLSADFTCVYSDENLPLLPQDPLRAPSDGLCQPADTATGPGLAGKKQQINGSAVHVTATFGFILAGLVVRDVVERSGQKPS